MVPERILKKMRKNITSELKPLELCADFEIKAFVNRKFVSRKFFKTQPNSNVFSLDYIVYMFRNRKKRISVLNLPQFN